MVTDNSHGSDKILKFNIPIYKPHKPDFLISSTACMHSKLMKWIFVYYIILQDVTGSSQILFLLAKWGTALSSCFIIIVDFIFCSRSLIKMLSSI